MLTLKGTTRCLSPFLHSSHVYLLDFSPQTHHPIKTVQLISSISLTKTLLLLGSIYYLLFLTLSGKFHFLLLFFLGR